MITNQDKIRQASSTSSPSIFSLQARVEQAELKSKNLEQSFLQLRSSFVFRVARGIGASAAFLREKIWPTTMPLTQKYAAGDDSAKCIIDSAGGYLLVAVIESFKFDSTLKIEFYGHTGRCDYFYQYPLNPTLHDGATVPGNPIIHHSHDGTHMELALYIGGEIAYLKAIITHSQSDDIMCPSLALSRVCNSGEFNHARLPTQSRCKSSLRIACILDQFTWTCLSPEAKLLQLKPNTDWKNFSWVDIDFLLVESAWFGEAGLWSGALGGENSRVRKQLEALLISCKDAGIPRVFWNKEDPVHYEYFKPVAEKFDYIFTTDENSVERYRSELSNSNVFCMPFFIQPEIHNPVKETKRLTNNICFAGTWYGSHHAERTIAMQGILDAAVPFGLDIYDRMYLDTETNYRFPLRYMQFIRGMLSYRELCEAHKHYACFININTVTDSPSMCARRVFEVLASSAPVVSNPSLSLKRYFKGGVLSASSQEEATIHFSRLLADITFRAIQGHLGFRSVMGEHTAAHRLLFITEKFSKSKPLPEAQNRSITLVSVANSEEDIESIMDMVRAFLTPDLNVLLGTTFAREEQRATSIGSDVLVVPVANSGLPGYEKLMNKINSRFAFIINPTVEYGINYINDKLLCFAYLREPLVYSHSRFIRCNNSIVCRQSIPEHEFTGDYDIDSLVVDWGNEFWDAESQDRNTGWFEGAIARLSADARIYATDSFNYLKASEIPNPGALRNRPAGFTEQDVFV